MSTFRDAIANTLMEQWPNTITRMDAARVTSDAVLDTPEMQAIRKALWNLAAMHALEASDTDTTADVVARLNLPESVIAWVLDGDT